MMRSYLDNYILPGTHTGTQILWLYMVEWRRDLAAVASLGFALLVTRLEFSGVERLVERSDDQKEPLS